MNATAKKPKKPRPQNRYAQLIEKIFVDRYSKGASSLEFTRVDIETCAAELQIKLPKNVGDILYSFRFRAALPQRILSTQSEEREWVIQFAGQARYRFLLAKANRIIPNPQLATIKVPDGTPEIIARYAHNDEQALLAKVRYNRLIDIFLGLTTNSLQNHLRTTAEGVGQIEIDELYIGIDTHGCHHIIPVQAKGGNDKISIVQTQQDIKWCKQKFPTLRCRAISAQFVAGGQIALFELRIEDDELLELKIVEERHYKLVPASELDIDEIAAYR